MYRQFKGEKRICDKICYSLSCCSKATQQWHGWGLLYRSTNCIISVRLQMIYSFLSASFLWFVRYCLCHHESLETTNIAWLQNRDNLIGWHQSRQSGVLLSRTSKRKITSVASNDHVGHLPEFQSKGKRSTYCSKEGKETFVVWLACNIPLCLVKYTICLTKHYM